MGAGHRALRPTTPPLLREFEGDDVVVHMVSLVEAHETTAGTGYPGRFVQALRRPTGRNDTGSCVFRP